MTMVQITVVVDELKYEDYKNVLIIMSYMWHDLNWIKSKDHNIELCRINKISLSSYDDKKNTFKDEYSILSHFH